MNNTVNATKTSTHLLIRWGAFSFLGMPLCYIVMFVIFGVILSFPQSGVVDDKISYIAAQHSLLSIAYITGYLVFGTLLLVSVQAIHARLKSQTSHLINLAFSFGFIWVVLMMCSGMIALIGMNTMLALYTEQSEHAVTLFYVYTTVVNGMGGGIELVGGVWVFLLSLHALRTKQLSKSLNVLGLVVGILGILTLIQSIPELKDAFGLSQIMWFIWVGAAMFERASQPELH